jgi:hypothetical protein
MNPESGERTDCSQQDQREFIESITPDAMRVLAARDFYTALDDRLSPLDDSAAKEECRHTYELASAILGAKGFPSQDMEEVIDVLRLQGACCDCEILYNVEETSRLKAKHWQAKVREFESRS